MRAAGAEQPATGAAGAEETTDLMIPAQDYERIAAELQALLRQRFADVTVQIGDNLHYHGTNIVITSTAFRDWLPEQRFHHVVRAIPAAFYDEHLRGAGVWFELAPGETGRDLMMMPRSEDVVEHEKDLLARLRKASFFKKLQAAAAEAPEGPSIDDLSLCRRLLREAGWNPKDVTQACLVFILHGGFCDAQVLADVMPTVAPVGGGQAVLPRAQKPPTRRP